MVVLFVDLRAAFDTVELQGDTMEDDEGEGNKGGVDEKMRRHVEGNKEEGEDRRGVNSSGRGEG